MHIKLINPRMNLHAGNTRLKFKLLPPQSLLLLAALTPPEHTCELVDENIKDSSYDDRPDLVAISVYVTTVNRACVIARHYRTRGVPVVMGGLHPTCYPDAVREYADSLVIGEADLIWPQLLRDLEQRELQSIYCNRDVVSLEQTPILRRSLCDARYYASVNAMRATRGCPYQCKYCYQSTFYARPGVRPRTIPHIIKEIESMQTRHVFFLDDNLIGDKQFARRLFTSLAPLEITWSGAATVNIGDDADLLQLAYESGCRTLFIGFESILPANLKANKKSQNEVTLYKQLVHNIHRQGIVINGSFIFGMDHDTIEVFEDTVEWVVKNKIGTATFHILTPYPGTPLFNELEQARRIIDYNWDHYDTAHAVFQPKHMSPQELEAGYWWACKSVYTWKNILRRMPDVPSLHGPFWGLNLAGKKFARLSDWLGQLGTTNFLFDVSTHLLQPNRKPKKAADVQDVCPVDKIAGTLNVKSLHKEQEKVTQRFAEQAQRNVEKIKY
jgi:radical SAM superfamily enzyme YgiQ (UPF0313 family)